MKIIGKLVGETNSIHFSKGAYVSIDAQWSGVETYSGASIEEDQQCMVVVGTNYLLADIQNVNGDYLEPETANSLIKDGVVKEVLDLDMYGMVFSKIWEITPDSICVRNEISDEDFSIIPLVVEGKV